MVWRHNATGDRHGYTVGEHGGIGGGDDNATPRSYVYKLSLNGRHMAIYATLSFNLAIPVEIILPGLVQILGWILPTLVLQLVGRRLMRLLQEVQTCESAELL